MANPHQIVDAKLQETIKAYLNDDAKDIEPLRRDMSIGYLLGRGERRFLRDALELFDVLTPIYDEAPSDQELKSLLDTRANKQRSFLIFFFGGFAEGIRESVFAKTGLVPAYSTLYEIPKDYQARAVEVFVEEAVKAMTYLPEKLEEIVSPTEFNAARIACMLDLRPLLMDKSRVKVIPDRGCSFVNPNWFALTRESVLKDPETTPEEKVYLLYQLILSVPEDIRFTNGSPIDAFRNVFTADDLQQVVMASRNLIELDNRAYSIYRRFPGQQAHYAETLEETAQKLSHAILNDEIGLTSFICSQVNYIGTPAVRQAFQSVAKSYQLEFRQLLFVPLILVAFDNVRGVRVVSDKSEELKRGVSLDALRQGTENIPECAQELFDYCPNLISRVEAAVRDMSIPSPKVK